MQKKEDILISQKGQKQLERMKEEYNAYQAPEELKERLKMMERENRKQTEKKTKHRIIWISAGTVGTVAAAVLTITILANSSQNVAMAMQKVPALGKIAEVVTFRTYENDTTGFEAEVEIPEIKSENSEAAEKVNKSMEEYVNQLIKEHEKDIEENKEFVDENGEAYTNKKSLDTQYTVLTNTDRLLSVRLDTTIVMAGSNAFSKIYHIDKLYDKEITLKDLFAKDTDYVTTISEEIKNQMCEQMKKDDMITYFIDSEDEMTSEWNFEKIKKAQNFYINDKKQLVLVFDKYEVAPGYMGQVEFTIDTGILSNMLSSLGKEVLK